MSGGISSARDLRDGWRFISFREGEGPGGGMSYVLY